MEPSRLGRKIFIVLTLVIVGLGIWFYFKYLKTRVQVPEPRELSEPEQLNILNSLNESARQANLTSEKRQAILDQNKSSLSTTPDLTEEELGSLFNQLGQ